MAAGQISRIVRTVLDDPRTLVGKLLCCSTLILLLFRLAGGKAKRSGGSIPPSPWRLPIIGNFHQLTANVHQGLDALSLKFGPMFMMRLGSVPVCVISSGEPAREVTNTHDAIFCNRGSTKASRALFSGKNDILFAPDNKFWKLTRRLCVSALLSPTNVQSLHHVREEEVAQMVTVIRSNQYQAVDLSDLFYKLASSILFRAVLGKKIGTDDEGRRASNELRMKLAVQSTNAITDLVSFEDFIPALSWLDHLTGLNRKLKKTAQTVHAMLDQVIDEREEIQSGNNIGGDDNDNSSRNDGKGLVNIILELQRKGMTGLDNLTRIDIRNIVLDMVLAGVSTTAAAMKWTMAELARNPQIMKKVQEEVRSVIGDKSEIRECDIDRMKYLKCVIKEGLRMHSPIIIGRRAATSVTIGGFKLPAGVTAWINLWAVHRNPTVWDRPSEFLPERFLNASYNFKGQDQVYFPFGLGKRICPGVDFAMTEVEYALASLLCWFDWELPDGVLMENLDLLCSRSKPSHEIAPLRLVPRPRPAPST
uniref:Cytochrome P450 n=1 Tax=Kalanchoe fedtschenkoi TaxID=63787 RepID=A0A7N0U0E9_KALFE